MRTLVAKAKEPALALALAVNLYRGVLGVPDIGPSHADDHSQVEPGMRGERLSGPDDLVSPEHPHRNGSGLRHPSSPRSLGDFVSEFPALAPIMSWAGETFEQILRVASTPTELDEALEHVISCEEFRQLMDHAIAVIREGQAKALIAHDFKSSAQFLEKAPLILSAETVKKLQQIRERNADLALEVESRLTTLRSDHIDWDEISPDDVDLNTFFLDPEIRAESRLAVYRAIEGFWCLGALAKAVDDAEILDPAVERELASRAIEGQSALIDCFRTLTTESVETMSMLEVDEIIADRARQASDGVWPPFPEDD